MSSESHIEGTSEVNFVTDYVRPLSCALLNLDNNFLRTYSNMYSKVHTSFEDENKTKIVSDGQSGDAFSRLDGSDVTEVSRIVDEISTRISSISGILMIASDSEAFTTNAINLRSAGTGGCAC
tara:strand:- start:55 stop:423 length:369 start_codon:yes stop_codon:yes gene_type:complete